MLILDTNSIIYSMPEILENYQNTISAKPKKSCAKQKNFASILPSINPLALPTLALPYQHDSYPLENSSIYYSPNKHTLNIRTERERERERTLRTRQRMRIAPAAAPPPSLSIYPPSSCAGVAFNQMLIKRQIYTFPSNLTPSDSPGG